MRSIRIKLSVIWICITGFFKYLLACLSSFLFRFFLDLYKFPVSKKVYFPGIVLLPSGLDLALGSVLSFAMGVSHIDCLE